METERFTRKTPIKNRFSETEIVGIGAFGTVYLGEEISTGSLVAIKKIKKSKLFDTWSEILYHYCASTHLDGVTKLLAYYHTKKEVVLIMDFYKWNLLEYVNYRRRLDESEAKILFKQLVETVYALDLLHIDHGDLKCENIMISSDYKKLYLTDFGLANEKTDDYYTHFGGTLTPPECVDEHSSYKQIDATMWALGWILFEMVCGNSPYVLDIKNEYFEFNVNVSEECKSLIMKLLCYNPLDRLKCFKTLLQDEFFQ